MTHYDLLVIGGGSGGVAAARASANLGAKVGIIEGEKFGGTCVNRGCMPKKFYMYASLCASEFKAAQTYGWQIDASRFNWKTLKENTFKEIARLNGIYDVMLDKAGVDVHRGFARFTDNKTVALEDTRLTADKFIIATGGKPFVPDIEGKEHVITSDEAFHLEQLPEKIVIVGGGYIAIEFAGIFNSLGVDTTLMIRKDYVLTGFDGDIQAHVQAEMLKKGVKIITRSNPISVNKNTDGSLVMRCDQDRQWPCDQVMFATGRVPMSDTVGLENTDVTLDAKGQIEVDEWQQTSVEHIYAIGDVTNRNHNLTPVAINEGRAFADTHFGSVKRNVSGLVVPTAVFSQPQIGTVGLTEAQACDQCGDIDIYIAEFGPTKYSLAKHTDIRLDEKILMKLVVDAKSDQVLGAHMVGPDSGEIAQILGVALKAGATKQDFNQTVGVHPTLAEEFVTMREMTRKGCVNRLENETDVTKKSA